MNMPLRIAVLIAVLGIALPVKAQEDATKMGLYAGYDYIRFHVNSKVNGVLSSDTFNGNGGGGQLEYDPNARLGIVGDLTAYAVTYSNGSLAAWVMPYLAGPRVNLHEGRITPYVQALFGGILASNKIGNMGSQNNFAMTAGGGINIRVSRRWSIRPVQAEYFLTKIPNGLNNRQNNFRFSAGIVLRFGRA